MTDLSIVIVSWNTKDLLRECLESIYRYTADITFELFVVDNASSDGSANMVKKLFPQVNLIENKQNYGFSKANNQAIRIAKGRYVALLNPDTLLLEDVFSSVIKYADQHEKIGAIGPKILSRDGRSIQNVCARKLPNLYFEFCRLSGLSRKYPATRIFGGEYMSYWDHNSSRYVEALSGACMVINRRVIDDVGLMDEKQFMYGDEIDWCKRILDAKWKIYYYSRSSIIHYGGESTKQAKLFANIEGEKAKCYYYQKYKGKLYAFLFLVQINLFSIGKYTWSIFFRSKNAHAEELLNLYKSVFIWSFKQLISKGNRLSI